MKKLKLNKESLRRLQYHELDTVVGGAKQIVFPPDNDQPVPTYNSLNPCCSGPK